MNISGDGRPSLFSDSIHFSLGADDFALSMEDGSRTIPPSCEYALHVSGHQPDDELGAAASNVVSRVGFKPRLL